MQMTSLKRFLSTMAGDSTRPPLFPEGLREGVLEAWRSQGFLGQKSLQRTYHYDAFYELDIATDLRRKIHPWPKDLRGLRDLRKNLDPSDPSWLPANWEQKLKKWRKRKYPLFLVVHDGLFLTMGIEDGKGFAEGILMLHKNLSYVQELMALQAEFEAGLAVRLMQDLHFDAAIFSEPIASNQGTLVSPKMYAELVLPSYAPLLETLKNHKIETIIWRSYANPRKLLPVVFGSGDFNCLWACETNPLEMDYLAIRRELGDGFGLIGGIDVDWLYDQPNQLEYRLGRVVLPLLDKGKFIPLADGRVRENVQYPNYAAYREALERLVGV